MANIKVRLVLNKGRHGAPLTKLGRIAEQLERFLRALASDSGMESRPGEWVAANFKNASVEYDAEYLGATPPGVAQVFVRGLEFLADFDPQREGLQGLVSPATALEYAKIGNLIDPDEEIGFGIYPVEGGQAKWRKITYGRMASIRKEIETPIPSYGAVQGILHAWFKETRQPNFQIRELSTDALIRVFYPGSLYGQVARAVQERSTMLIVGGDMLLDRSTRQAVEMTADRIEPVRMLTAAEFEAFVGSAPDYEPATDDDDTYWDAA